MAESSGRSATIFLVLRLGIGIALLAWLALSGALRWATLLGLAHHWPLTLAALAILLVAAVITSWRLCILYRPQDLRISLFASLRLTLMSLFFNIGLPGSAGGEVVRMYYAARGNEGRRTEVITVLIVDRLIGLFALVSWPVLAAAISPSLVRDLAVLKGLVVGAAGMSLAMIVAAIVFTSRRVFEAAWLRRIVSRFPLTAYADRVLVTARAYRDRPGMVLAAIAISLVGHTLSIAVILVVALAVHPVGVASVMALLVPFGQLANALPLTPGGLGVGEAALHRLFAMAGFAGGAEVLLAWRVVMVLFSLSGLAFYLQGRREFVRASGAGAAGSPRG